MLILHFAYGSNLCIARLSSRMPGVMLVSPARLDGYELRWHKKSNDGSGKLDIVPSAAAGAVVHGAVFGIPGNQKRDLDRSEGLHYGYDETHLTVETQEGLLTAQTYVAAASRIDAELRPYTWYRDLVIAGAERLSLPGPYIDDLRTVQASTDPDATREKRERRYIKAALPYGTAFRRHEFLRLAVLAALQRSSTYRKDATDAARTAFRADLSTELDSLSSRYVARVSEAAHLDAIDRLSKSLSQRHSATLRDGRFRIGVAQKALNLYLKYLWCEGWICMPPHCPFDARIIDLLEPKTRPTWTALDSIAAYRDLVADAKSVTDGRSLALWELEEYPA